MNRRECPTCYGTGLRAKELSFHEFVPCEQCGQKGWIVPILAKRDRFYEEDMKAQSAARDEKESK